MSSAAKKSATVSLRKKVEIERSGGLPDLQPSGVTRRLIIYVATAVLGGKGGWGLKTFARGCGMSDV